MRLLRQRHLVALGTHDTSEAWPGSRRRLALIPQKSVWGSGKVHAAVPPIQTLPPPARPICFPSFLDDDCTNTFTPNQVARMHCYLDLVYQRWSQGKKPTPIPIPPMVTGQTQDSLSIYWLPPISGVINER